MGGNRLPIVLLVAIVLVAVPLEVNTELTPPYFNLAEGRKITASSTCGVDTDGPELYCKLVGAHTENDQQFHSLIQGQVCDYCQANSHPAEYAIDGKENWWQSPPLSRGMKFNEVNLTIDFGQEFHVAYLFIRMGNSPRPGLWTLEKSSDYGKTWSSWQHFSDSPTDCEIYFGKDSLRPITRDDDVICTTEFSKIVPLESGEIPVRLLNSRPSANNYFNSTVLQEWTRATNVRIRLLRTKNLLGHLMSVARQDPTVTRRYFYSIKDISIGGRCMCNGHANTCNILDPRSANRVLACQCQHNTCGIQCQECCPGFEQKKWSQNTNARPFNCEPCNCFGHSNKCVYSEDVDLESKSLDIHGNYEGGGVCQNCQHNTEGVNCNKCKATFYRPYEKHWNETDVCRPCNCNYFYSTGNCEEGSGQCECRVEFEKPNCDSCSVGYFGYPICKPCECNLNGTLGYHCEAIDGKCPCKENFGGDFCKQCAPGYYNYPECKPCNCEMIGSIGDTCNEQTGQCECSSNYAGLHCDQCKNGYYGYPACIYANCDVHGTQEEICNKQTGECLCREGYGGIYCDRCITRYYGYPECVPCNCSAAGSSQDVCDITGKCPCLSNYAGKQCNVCSAGYYQYPECLACNCDSHGARGISCNNDGQCTCENNFDSKTCSSCKEGYYNFPACEECNCDPAGVIPKFAGCGSVPAGELCQCKERVQGRVCDQCRPLYWNLNSSNVHGCEECDCFIDGTIGGLDTCETKTGQCSCKPSVQGRSCNECADGKFDLFGGSLFGCRDCGCDIGGSDSTVCNKASGDCKCHPRISGRDCTRPLTTHYFPTLYQFKFEYEDGYTTTGAQVRYQFDEHVFPGYSKIGYAVISPLQNEVFNEVNIVKSSVYRLIIRYINPTSESVVGDILIQSDNPLEVDQYAKVLLKPNQQPEFVTMSGSKGEIPSPIVLDPGRYTISIKTENNMFLDYFVLLPAAYYEATILTRDVENPCKIDSDELCRKYKYPSIIDYNPVFTAHVNENDGSFEVSQFYTNIDHLSALNEDQLPLITEQQSELNYMLRVPKQGRYVIVVDYITDPTLTDAALLSVNQADETEQDGIAMLYPCIYRMVCRQPVIDKESREKVFFIEVNDMRPIIINGETIQGVAIKSITAIPYEQWSIDYIQPQPVCVMQNGQCVQSTYLAAPNSKKIDFEVDHEDMIDDNIPDISLNTTKVIYLDRESPNINVTSRVHEPGHYVIIMKYYQPNHPKFNMNYKLETDRQNYDGKVSLGHCPSNSGCRVVVKQDNGYVWFDIEDSFTFSLTNDQAKGVWLDYILLVPADQFSEQLLHEEEFDQTKEFITKCGQDHYNIQLNASEFCKSSVFSLTADYNSGALPCSCDYYGSNSFECEQFGGQCQCKANIIGRQCEACKTGFYGFPDCKPCSCPSTAICEKETGECICPPRVTGEKCDKCVSYTFGFDQIIGCEECNCNILGVERKNMQCDLNNGTCQCKPNVVGRMCDKCANGFFNYPHCEPCRCDVRGTTLEICDQEDETCFCKPNVIGRECNFCNDGTYNLQGKNADGCTKCFCFGKTTRCENAYLRPFNVSILSNVSLNTISVKGGLFNKTEWFLRDGTAMVNETSAQVALQDVNDKDLRSGITYFGMLDFFANQNNHLTAYGDYLRYNLHYTTSLFGNALIAPDVILEGKTMSIKHTNYRQPASDVMFYGAVEMVESNFQTLSGSKVSREEFMTILRDLKKIYIRASYFDESMLTVLSDVILTLADEDSDNYNLYQELGAEKCSCPPGYDGLSCQDCAPGYYRDPDGPHGGYCIPCECNGHAQTCDCNTGVCQECQHYTTGEHCDECIEGYYGNATIGTPYDCMICACPLPIESNNFAHGCDVSPDGYEISCECKTGYTGHKCQSCASGFYGRPEYEGEFCVPCSCSGNIDPENIGSCDSVSGECLQCLNNTYGAACNLCAPGYYGDAIKLKDCQSCVCDDKGTDYCDNYIGTCNCLPNVVGEKCDRCELDHYGFETGYGCAPCDCGIAANSTQCDDNSGDCACKPGVTGRRCDRCIPGYWNYGPDGCVPCSCNTDYSRGASCNAETGQCECLRDVIGEKCDSCPHRWVFIDEHGCEECTGCQDHLLDVTDELRNKLSPVEDLKTVAKSFYTTQKLFQLNQTADELKPLVESLDPNVNNLSQQIQEIDSLEMDVKNQQKGLTYRKQNAQELGKDGENLEKEALQVMNNNRLVTNAVRNTIKDVKKLANSLEKSEKGSKNDEAVKEAEDYLDKIKAFDSSIYFPVKEQQCKMETVFGQVDEFAAPVNRQLEQVKLLNESIILFGVKFDDLMAFSRESIAESMMAEQLTKKNKESRLGQKFETVSNYSKEAENKLIDGNKLRAESKKIIMNTDLAMDDIKNLNKELLDLNDNADHVLPINYQEMVDLQPLLQQTLAHAQSLTSKADDLIAQYSNITAKSGDSIRAATAYQNIDNNVDLATKSSENATIAADMAIRLTEGIDDRAGKSDQLSSGLLSEAKDSLNLVQSDLQPHLDASSDKVKEFENLKLQCDDQLNGINASLDQIKAETQTDIWNQAKEEATEADALAKKSLDIFKPIEKEIEKANELAKKLPKEIENTNKEIAQASNQIQRVDEAVPKILDLADELDKKQANTASLNSEIGDGLDRLRKRIEVARALANSIKVGVEFMPNTTLELETPENIQSMGTNSKISIFFKTDKPNGFLLYLGNEKNSTRNKRNDFMALEIENGYPVLSVDLGDGSQRIINSKLVSDDKWYEAIIERTGKEVSLTIREEDNEGNEKTYVKKEELPGAQSVFDVDQDSRLFVGGYSDFDAPESIVQSSFEGEIENLKIGDKDVGLWNFVDGQNNLQGANERDRLVSKEAPTTGYRFGGNGYVILDAKPFSFKTRSNVQFKFKAGRDSPDGLLFFAGKNHHFISVELREGAIVFQYKMGQQSEVVVIKTDLSFNDDEWHKVEATREGAQGVLRVDDRNVFQESAYQPTEAPKHKIDKMYFGGHPEKPNRNEITKKSFDGCIDDVLISGQPVDLSLNLGSYDVLPGCPMKFSSILSYHPHEHGYLKMRNFTVGNKLHINLKFKTKQQKGVIFYGMNNDQSSTFSLTLDDGILVLRSTKYELNSGSETFNDGEWHVVTATQDERRLRLSIDDAYFYNTEEAPPALYITFGEIYFGGFPKNFKAVRGAVPNDAYFIGCIQDVTMNGAQVNFANSTDKQSAILNNCARDLFDYETSAVPYYYPDGRTEAAIEGSIDSRFDDSINEISTEKIKKQDSKENQRGNDRGNDRDGKNRGNDRDGNDRGNDRGGKDRDGNDRGNDRDGNERGNDRGGKDRDENERGNDRDGNERSREDEEENHTRSHQPNLSEPTTTSSTSAATERATTATATVKTTTSKPRPIYTPDQKESLCALPVIPEYDVGFEAGYRFGTGVDSHIEFEPQPGKTKGAYDFTMEFRTNKANGILFYAADSRHTDFVAVYMRNGYLHHVFSSGSNSKSGAGSMQSSMQYDDNEWHQIKFTRSKKTGTLVVDSDESSGSAQGSGRTMDLSTPWMVGGATNEILEEIGLNLKLENGFLEKHPFFGCIKNIRLDDKLLDKPTKEVSVVPCSDQTEKGIFIGKSGGYIKLYEKFNVGGDLKISMDIKPRNRSALLLSVHGKKTYFILEMVEGRIQLSVESGQGPITAIFKPDRDENFCDGQWRTVTAIKSQYVITIMVNDVSSEPAIGDSKAPTTPTTRPLFIGGHPHMARIRGLTARQSFQGCIRNIKINDNVENILPSMTVGSVETGVCPIN